MARMTDFSRHELLWATGWYLREETLREATTKLVNYHYHLPLNRFIGDGADFKRIALDAILDATKYGKTRAVHRPLVAVPGGLANTVIELETVTPAASLLDAVIEAPQSKKLLDSMG